MSFPFGLDPDIKRINDGVFLFVGGIALIALLWFAGSTRSQVKDHSDAPANDTPQVTAGH